MIELGSRFHLQLIAVDLEKPVIRRSGTGYESERMSVVRIGIGCCERADQERSGRVILFRDGAVGRLGEFPQ